MSPHLYATDPSASTLHRNGSRSSVRSGLIPSPRPSYANLNDPPSGDSSASASRSGSFMSTPRILSRRNSAKDRPSGLFRKVSQRHAPQDVDLRSPVIEPIEVIETPHVKMDRDPESGRKMINQYLVLNEIGHGTHGRVRLGQDLNAEEGGPEYYAIKIVDRNPKRKRLMGLARQRASNAGMLVNENEHVYAATRADLRRIRKEIAIFKKVNHPNVVRMREIIDDPESSKLFMILEYCERGEVAWKAEDGSPALDLASIQNIFRQTVLGLEYLHHQGIIHRDIKPSNLLLSSDGTVKISDFGCSHYSEALRSSQLDGDAYVDDIELAKTAGSPAFFAPEMCYSGDLLSPSDGPAVTLRPPSIGSLEPIVSNDSSSTRSNLTSTARRDRLPITNAIDVWALGVTLYCLLFGRTPFDAANEYLLMQVIPLAEVELPSRLARDGILRTSYEGAQCLNLLVRLLEKIPARRITLEKIKNHPFTLHGLPDPGDWLASTDPHAQSFVTVSNDEVAQIVVKSSSFREKIKRGVSSIANRLQIISNTRNRSRSIGEDDSPPSAQRSAPSGSPASLARRFSILGSASPRRSETRIVNEQPHTMASQSIAQPLPQRATTSPTAPLRRRQSSDIDSMGRQRSPSSTSSNGHLGSKLVRLLSRSGSQRNPPSSPRRMSSDSHPARVSMETFETSSSVPPHPTTQIREDLDEEVDWNETLSDDEDYTPALRPSAPNFGWQNEVGDTEDDGLAISLDSRRGRKGSMKL